MNTEKCPTMLMFFTQTNEDLVNPKQSQQRKMWLHAHLMPPPPPPRLSTGAFLLYDGIFGHFFFHLLRWGREGDIGLLFTSTTGVTGLVDLILLPLTCMPMMICRLKRCSWECRKGFTT